MSEGMKDKRVRERKFAWVDKWVHMTGDRARIDAKANDTYIVYESDDGLVQEYPDGKIVKLNRLQSDKGNINE